MILALDLGSTSFKAGVFTEKIAASCCRFEGDEALALLAKSSRKLKYDFASGGRVELGADEALAAAREVIREALDSSGVQAGDIRAVSVTSQAQTFTVWNETDGAKIPFISWQDTRAQDASRSLSEGELADFAEHASFAECTPGLQVCKLKHVTETIQQEDLVLNLPTFFVKRWTGRAVIDANLAAMSGLYSLAGGGWWPRALGAVGVREAQLPSLIPVGTVAAATNRGAEEFGLGEGVPVVLAGNDQTAGAYAARLHENGALLLTLGTAQVAFVSTRAFSPPAERIVRGPYPGGRHYRMVADSCGCNILNWAEGILAGCGSDEAFFARAEKARPGCGGLVFEADLTSGRGAWKNAGLHHTPGDFARSVIECLVRRMVTAVETLGVDPRPPFGRTTVGADLRRTTVLAAGGGSRHPLWVRILSEALGAEITVVEADPLLGAAMMAEEAVS